MWNTFISFQISGGEKCHVYVPLNDDVIEGKWIALDPHNAEAARIDAFSNVHNALLNMGKHREQWSDLL